MCAATCHAPWPPLLLLWHTVSASSSADISTNATAGTPPAGSLAASPLAALTPSRLGADSAAEVTAPIARRLPRAPCQRRVPSHASTSAAAGTDTMAPASGRPRPQGHTSTRTTHTGVGARGGDDGALPTLSQTMGCHRRAPEASATSTRRAPPSRQAQRAPSARASSAFRARRRLPSRGTLRGSIAAAAVTASRATYISPPHPAIANELASQSG
mmetsp:Transcript_1898/g.5436  ORF Transcript_1898/g.5436 Transcript_1898/m.5436 type:complete len:215 (-) Transcript_1898:44-688(-)